MKAPIAFARRVFFWAGIYGIIAIVPLYVLEDRLARDLLHHSDTRSTIMDSSG